MSSHSTETSPIAGIAPLGGLVHEAGVSYRVWAPDHGMLGVRIRRRNGGETTLQMEPHDHGYFIAEDRDGRCGDRYGFVLPDGAVLPDPASRFQPEGVHAFSECVDPRGYAWQCAGWQRPGWRGQSIYELHVGAFTPEGTFRAAIGKLEHIAATGVNAVEIMPLADFPGQRNWGYDGVALFAPARCYGRPDDLRALVDAAHERGLAVILDVVYNHLGPDGNYLSRFARAYFRADRSTPWGDAFNLSEADSRPVRDYFVANAAYWLDEFRFDGLRLDATHAMVDDSPRHLLAEIAEAAHERGAFLIAEDERNSCEVLRHEDGRGAQIDAVWSDDFHHQVRVALTGVQDSYYKNYRGSSADLARTLEKGWFYTGQPFPSWNGRPRGEDCAHLPASAFVCCIENHDQIGNRARGERLEHLVGPAAFRAASALLCLSPFPPLIFMGQEWAAGTPFLFFTDHAGELGKKISEGRRKEFPDHGAAGDEVPDPQAEETFRASKLSWEELLRYPHATVLALYRACFRQRATWLQHGFTARDRWKAAAFERAVAIRYTGSGTQPDRLLVTSLQGDTRLSLLHDPVLRAPAGCTWRIEFESNASIFDTDNGPVSIVSILTAMNRIVVETLVFGPPATILLRARKLGELGSD